MSPKNKITWEEWDQLYPQLEEIEIEAPEQSPVEPPLPPKVVRDLLWRKKKQPTPQA